ncbi:MAG: precorrin-3B C(17)-methyltransferase [Candidatus Bathyarchaeota archaeon]|nr:precorrin-3B C(17)-methyltransferase [Candidatus Bathyarchaeota archaeon]
MTPKARHAIETADAIVGYKTYIALIQDLIKPDAEIVAGTMGREVDRAKAAVEKAQENKHVAVISSGDAGVYGMAGVVLEAVAFEKANVPVEVVAGVTAATAAAANLGAPLVSDFAVISLSDLLTPWSLIEKRLEAAAQADFAIVLYNPQSMGRTKPLHVAHQILLKHKNPKTPVGIVRAAGREGEQTQITTLQELLDCKVDMVTTLIVGTSTTQIINGKMVTPRGYDLTRQAKTA